MSGLAAIVALAQAIAATFWWTISWSILYITAGTVLKERLFSWKAAAKPIALRRFGAVFLCQALFCVILANPWSIWIVLDSSVIPDFLFWPLAAFILPFGVDCTVFKLLTKWWVFKRLSWQVSFLKIAVANVTISPGICLLTLFAVRFIY